MRVTRYTPRTTTRPFNKIFESYGDVLTKLFDERADVDPNSTYVAMPTSQQELIDFALSGSQEVGLLVGDIGIGKSSVLKYLREVVWPSQSCVAIFKDFSEDSESIHFPKKFYKLSAESQKQHAVILANAKIVSMVKGAISPWLWSDIQSNPTGFLSFLDAFYPEYVPDEARLSPGEPLKVISTIQRKSKRKFFLATFHYYIHANDIRHVKFVVDNLDDKEVLLLSAVVDLAAHLARGIKRFNEKEISKEKNAPLRWMTVIVACRPNTAQSLQSSKGNGSGWHGFHEIVIGQPCSLSEAVKKRYENDVKGKMFPGESDRKLRFTLGDKPWTISNRDSFFAGLCDAFQNAGQANQIVALSNNNMAKAMTYVLEVARNIHFVKDEDLVVAVMPNTSNDTFQFARDAFTRTSVLRALAYGNQGDVKPHYPIDFTPVVNLIESKRIPFGGSTFKLRVIAMFSTLESSGNKSTQISVGDICKMGEQFFGVDTDIAMSVVDELCEQGVLGNSRFVGLPSVVGTDCALSLLPRGELLWRLLSEDSILLQCYRDDCELDRTIEWKGRRFHYSDRPTQELLIEEVGTELIWMVRQLWVKEVEELESVASRGQYSELVRLCGIESMSGRLLKAVSNSMKRFFSRYPGFAAQSLQSATDDLAIEIDLASKRWTEQK
jgi:hypothetical protein